MATIAEPIEQKKKKKHLKTRIREECQGGQMKA